MCDSDYANMMSNQSSSVGLSLFVIKEIKSCNFLIKNKPKLIHLTLVNPSFDFPKTWKKCVLYRSVTFRSA